MTQDDKSVELSQRAIRFKEAIRQSIAKAWVKERYASTVETPPELNALVARISGQDGEKV
jgi:hypothetical protein